MSCIPTISSPLPIESVEECNPSIALRLPKKAFLKLMLRKPIRIWRQFFPEFTLVIFRYENDPISLCTFTFQTSSSSKFRTWIVHLHWRSHNCAHPFQLLDGSSGFLNPLHLHCFNMYIREKHYSESLEENGDILTITGTSGIAHLSLLSSSHWNDVLRSCVVSVGLGARVHSSSDEY